MDKKMNILVVTDKFPPIFEGGYEIVCYNMVEKLKENGHRVHVLTTDYKLDGKRDRAFHNGVCRGLKSIYSGLNFKEAYFHSLVKRAYWARYNYYFTSKVIRELNPSLVYSFQLYVATFAPLLAARHNRIPVVAHIADDWLSNIVREFHGESGLAGLKKKLVFGWFDVMDVRIEHLIANSRRTAALLERRGAPGENTSVLPHSINERLEKQLLRRLKHSVDDSRPAMEEELRIVYGGRLCKEKGLADLIEIVAGLREKATCKSIVVDIFGRGEKEYEAYLREQVHRYSLGDVIRFHGLVSHDEFQDALRDYHVFLFPFLWEEPFGMVVIEAMASGVVMVASDRGGPGETISHDHDGILVEPGDIDGFIENVLNLVKDRDNFDAIVENGYKTAAEKYTTSVIFEKVEAILLNHCNLRR